MPNPRLYTRVAIVLMRVSAETLAGACAAYSARRSMASGVVCCVLTVFNAYNGRQWGT
jgi:hypothetical protein